MNPGPYYKKDCFNFMSWNLNSLAKANNVTFEYDLISICETSLNDSVELIT